MSKKKTKKVEEEVDDVLIENKDSSNDNDDFSKITDEMSIFIKKKELIPSDFVKIKSQFDFNNQVVIFRQRALKHIGEQTMSKYPTLLTKSQFRMMLHDHDTRFQKQKKEMIQKIRHEENKSGSVVGRTRSERRRNEIEILKNGKGLHDLLDGYVIHI